MLNGAVRSVAIKGFVGKEKDFSSQGLTGSQRRVANTGEIRSLRFRTGSSCSSSSSLDQPPQHLQQTKRYNNPAGEI